MPGAISYEGNPLFGMPSSADQINYNNTSSGLSATQVQDAIDELKSGLMNQIPPDDTPNDFNNMYDRSMTMYRIGDSAGMTNAPASGLYGVVIAYRFGAYILQVFHHSNGMYQRFSFDRGNTWSTWLQIK